MTVPNPQFTRRHDWAELPPSPAFAHHDIAAMADGNILTARAEGDRCVILDPQGTVLREFGVPVANVHSLECVGNDGNEQVWITDNIDCQVVRIDLKGNLQLRLRAEDFPIPAEASFCPTGTAVDPVDGGLWVADGYGSNAVYRFDASLEHQLTLDGTEGAGRFNTPHSVYIDSRSDRPLVYVSDRANDRVPVYTRDGEFVRVLEGPFRQPSAFASLGDHLAIAELAARIVVCDREDRIVARLGDGTRHLEREGWPNRTDAEGRPASPRALIAPSEFNSPHGLCSDAGGNLYVTEWLIGDRFTKLIRCHPED